MWRRGVSGRALACVVSACAVVACGGGDGTPAGAQPMVEVQGTVVDGPLQGMTVHLDLDGDLRAGVGEPVAATGADGAFVLQLGELSAGQLATAMLVARPAGEDAGSPGLPLLAPAAAWLDASGGRLVVTGRAVISPVSTLVAAEVAANGMTAQEARESVAAALGLGGQDPLAQAAAGEPQLQALSRRAGPLLADAARTGAHAGDEGGSPTARLAATAEAVKSRLAPSPAAEDTASSQAAASSRPDADGNTRLIVRLRDGVEDTDARALRLAGPHRAQLRHTFRRAMKGFAVTLPDDAVAGFVEAAQRDPGVDMVEVDQVVTGYETQSNATWGLDRSDQRELPLSRTYTYSGTGSGVNVYIVDSGIRASHYEFEGRVQPGYSAINDGRGTGDCNGHGTHVAGTVGGRSWGMAKGVNLIPVRVLGCDNRGYVSGIIAGIDWMVANARYPAVANLSLGASASTALDAAVANAVARGITVAVAAGNSNANACNYSPARAPAALTVGATTSSDSRASYSNYGSCLDLFGPGSSVTSAGIASDGASYVMNGTSMATPHVAGLAALHLQANPAATPAAVAAAIRSAATLGKVANAGSGSLNALLYAALADTAAPPPSTAPAPVPAATATLAVASLSGRSWTVRRYWRASVTVAVKNGSGALQSGVLVQGGFSAGGSSASCTTASNGTCVLSTGNIGGSTARTTFSITGLSRSGFSYDAAANAAASVVIEQP